MRKKSKKVKNNAIDGGFMKVAILEKLKNNKFIGPYIKAEEDQKELGLFVISGWTYVLCLIGLSPTFLAYKKQYKEASIVILIWAFLIFIAPNMTGETGKTINILSAFYTYYILNNKFIKGQKKIFDQPGISDEEKIRQLKEANSTSKQSAFLFAGLTLLALAIVSYFTGTL